MCSSFEVITDTEQLLELFRITNGKELVITSKSSGLSSGKFRMRPTDPVLIIRKIDGEYCLDTMRWGFQLQTGPMVNSRLEEIIGGKTADYWQSLLNENPCLFVMSGYHEWKKVVIDIITPKTKKPTKKTEKHPFRFTIKEQDTFFCAGYYRKEGNDFACTMITTVGNALTNIVHDKGRMPVILDLNIGMKFLEADLEEKIALCQTYPPDRMNSEPAQL
jgi:putative SOS response-associated peptidase YedK